MKSNFFLFIYFFFLKNYSNSFLKKKNIFKNIRLLDETDTDSDYIITPSDIDTTYDTINKSDMINTEIKNSSRRFSVGLIIAIVIPSIVVIIGLIVIGIVCSRVNSPPPKPNLPNKNIDISSSELNKVVNSSQANRIIPGDIPEVNN